MSKLSYILKLCEHIVDLAKSRTSPFYFQKYSNTRHRYLNSNSDANIANLNASFKNDQFIVADETVKKAEQLILYLKALQLLKPVLCFAKDEIQSENLKQTNKVCKLIKKLNNIFKFCLYQSKQLNSIEVMKNKWNLEKLKINADKLLYLHAIELCREAALGEFFGKPFNVGFEIERLFRETGGKKVFFINFLRVLKCMQKLI